MDYIKNVASVLEMVEPVDGVIKISADVRDLLVKLMRGQERWISVKDEMPEKPEGYPHSEIRRSYFLVALKSGCVESLGFEFDRMQWQHTGSPVTHWMPLPEPPKEVKQDDHA